MVQSWQQAQRILEILSSLSYEASNLDRYLQEIAAGVSQLLELDWSVVTLCWESEDREQVMASTLDLGEGEHIYSLHGSLTNTVFQTEQTLCVANAIEHPEYGEPPEGYMAYLGVPLRTAQGKIIGTICSFCCQMRQFTVEEVRTVELFAERAATAIENYHLYQQERRFHELLEIEVAKRTEELRAAQAASIEQERLAAIGQFAASIVHEIRNPMTTILMGLNYFHKNARSESEQLRASLALDEVRRLQELLSEILLYAKPQVMQLEELELNGLIESMLVLLQEMPEATERHIKSIYSPAPVKILGDKDKLKQILINLVRNACEAIAVSEIVTCQIELTADPNQVCLCVHNGGTPIPAEILPRLTEPFYSQKSGGTGLGLAIVQRLVDIHGLSLIHI